MVEDIWDVNERLRQQQPPMKRRRRRPEAKVQKAIATWLAQLGVPVAITDAGAYKKIGLNFSCGIPAGWPDLTACFPGGKFVGIECKSARGGQSEQQVETQAKIESLGGVYIVAHSLAEAQKKITETPWPNGWRVVQFTKRRSQ